MQLPDTVINALRNNRKIEAIKLLRVAQGIGLRESKEMIEAYLREHPEIRNTAQGADKRPMEWRSLLWIGMIVCAIGWALVTSVNVVGAVIVLANHSGYEPATFVIEKVQHQQDDESGLYWGFEGEINGQAERLYAPDLIDKRRPTVREIREQFPPNTELAVWYNPKVTRTFVQRRTLNVIPYVEDLAQSERNKILWWLQFAVFPLVALCILDARFSAK